MLVKPNSHYVLLIVISTRLSDRLLRQTTAANIQPTYSVQQLKLRKERLLIAYWHDGPPWWVCTRCHGNMVGQGWITSTRCPGLIALSSKAKQSLFRGECDWFGTRWAVLRWVIEGWNRREETLPWLDRMDARVNWPRGWLDRLRCKLLAHRWWE